MASQAFDEEVAIRLERIYMGPDVVAQRADTLARLALRPGEAVIDIGSGPGFLCAQMADAVGPKGRVRGVDLSGDMIARAASRKAHDWIDYAQGDATALPETDGTYDVAVSTQVAEYVAEIDRFAAEMFRVLRPGGRGAVLATDWDAVIWHSDDPGRMAEVLAAWEGHCANPRLPRTLGPVLRDAGFEITGVSAFPIINTAFEDGTYSHGSSHFIRAYVERAGGIAPGVCDAWQADLEALSAAGRYFFASNRFTFEVAKPV